MVLSSSGGSELERPSRASHSHLYLTRAHHHGSGCKRAGYASAGFLT